MNKAALNYIADAIENAALAERDIGFNMHAFLTEERNLMDFTRNGCQTVGCIAGWSFLMLRKNGTPRTRPLYPKTATRGYEALIKESAQDSLGLEKAQADELFYAHRYRGQKRFITTQRAVAVLRNLAATGKVTWSISLPPVKARAVTKETV